MLISGEKIDTSTSISAVGIVIMTLYLEKSSGAHN